MTLRLILTAALLALAAPALAKPPSPEAFARDMIERLRKANPKIKPVPSREDPLTLTADLPGQDGESEPLRFNLHGIFAYCAKASAPDCEAYKARWIRGVTSADTMAATTGAMRIVVRPDVYVDEVMKLRDKDGRMSILARPIGDDLFMVLAADLPDAIMLLGPAKLEELEVKEDEAWTVAAVQTRSILPPLPKAAAVREKWQVYQGDAYMASMALDLPAWQALSDEVGPDLFITVTSDQGFIVGLVKDGPELEALARAAAADCEAAQRCISPHVYRFRGGKWVIAQ